MIGTYRIITLCTSRIYDPQIHSFIEIFNELIKKSGMRLLVFSLDTDLYWREDDYVAEAEVFRFIPYERSDIIVIMDEKIKSSRISQKIITKANAHGKPVIVLDGSYPGCYNIRFDFASGFEMVVRHVIEKHGVRNPHFMAGIKGNKFSEERQGVFKKVIEENGIPFSDDMVSYGDFWAEPARAAMQEVLKRVRLPGAVICANDIMAFNVCDVLREAGISVPEQIIVTGFDGYDEAYITSPALTTVDCSLVEMAQATSAAVMEIVAGRTPDAEKLVVPTLVKNESCGCPRCKKRLQRAVNRFNNGFYRYQDDIRIMHNTISNLMTVRSLDEAVSFIHNKYTQRTCMIVKQRCFLSDRSFFQDDDHEGEDEFVLFYDPLMKTDEPVPFDTKEVIPYIEERLEAGYPLLIQSIDYMNRSMGYLCYFFDSYNITEYGKTANITEMVSMGLGGYVTLQYQRYLAKKVEDIYKYDMLTGLNTRVAFQMAFDELKAVPEDQGKDLVVVMADLDNLKRINDKFGHSAGDCAIASVAHALMDACPPNSLFMRFGGDEMLALITGETSGDGIQDRIEDYLADASKEHGFKISASVGVYTTNIDRNLDIEELISKADEDMYTIKRSHHSEMG